MLETTVGVIPADADTDCTRAVDLSCMVTLNPPVLIMHPGNYDGGNDKQSIGVPSCTLCVITVREHMG